MELSSENVVDEAQVRPKRKFKTVADRFREYEVARMERETPFTGHQCKALRQQMGYTVKQLARLINCSMSYMNMREQDGGNFGPKFRVRLHKIKKYTDLAQADLRDRYEMPNFNK